MNVRTFDDALDAALDAVRGGTPIEQVLAAWPEHGTELRALLTPLAAAPGAQPPFDAARIAGGYRRVRGAVLDARDAPRAWWRRPVSFASLSIPAGILAIAAIGAAGAAAGGTAAITGQDLPAAVEQIVTLGTHGGGNGHATPHGNGNPNSNGQNGAGGGSAGADATHPTGQPEQVTASGVVSDTRGNVFVLTASDGTAWKVNIDGDTQVTGAIADGATVTVTGDVTSTTDKILHADSVNVTAAAPAAPQGAATPAPPNHGTGPEHTPGVPQGTPGPGSSNSHGPSATPEAISGSGSGPPGQGNATATSNGIGGGTGRKP
jgi:hypothetical protein